jgi:hypothetical protein
MKFLSVACFGACLAFLVASCGGDTEPSEGIGAVQEELSKCDGGKLGASNYCTATCQCVLGEGRCSADADCVAGLFCAGKLAYFASGLAGKACTPAHCNNKVKDGDETQVDCGGSCGTLCPDPCAGLPANGLVGHCTSDCPCPNQQGDCGASSDRCQSGFCKVDVGSHFGFTATIDVCLPAHCNTLLQDGNETGVDCGGSCIPCPPGDVQSANFGGPTRDHGYGIAYDPSSGGFVIAGTFSGTASFGGPSLTSAGGSDVFVARYNALGAHLWSKAFGSSGPDGDLGVDVGVDNSGNVVLAANFYGTITAGGADLVAAGTSDLFVVKMNGDGLHQWSKRFGAPGEVVRAAGVSVQGTGAIGIGGAFTGTVPFGTTTLTSAGGYDALVLKLTTNGGVAWARGYGGSGNDHAPAIAFDRSGDFHVGGSFVGDVDFGTGPQINNGIADAFVMKITGSGTGQGATIWAKTFGGPGNDAILGGAVDLSRQPVFVGRFRQTVDFGGGSVMSGGASDVFTVALDATGNYRWSRQFGGTGEDRARGVTVDSSGNVIVVGEFRNTVDFDAGPRSAASGATAAFVVKYSASTGAFVLGEAYGTASAASAADVAVTAGTLNFTGEFSGTASFGGAALTSNGQLDMFFSKIPH